MRTPTLSCLSVLMLSFFSLVLPAQTGFQKIFGSMSNKQNGYAGLQTADKGFAVFGYTRGFGAGNWDYYLLKTDSAGAFSWSKSYGGNGDDEGFAMDQTKDGGFILCGYTRSFGAGGYDVYLVKTNSIGDTLWTKTYGGTQNDFGNTVSQTADGGYIVAGSSLSFPAGVDTSSAYLIKTDAFGKLEWSKTYGGTKKSNTSYTDAYFVQQTADKGYVLTGYTNGFGEPGGDAFLLKTDSLGGVQFMKTYGGKGSDWTNYLVPTKDGGYLLTGSLGTDSTGLDNDLLLIKTDSKGDTLFTKTYSGPGYDYGQSLVVNAAGYTIAGATTSFGGGGYDGFLLKTDLLGDTLFGETFGGPNYDDINALSACSNGGYALYGTSESFDPSLFSEFYLIRTDTNGNGSCNRRPCPFTKKKLMLSVNTVSPQLIVPATLFAPTKTHVASGGVMADACGNVDVKDLHDYPELMTIYPNPGAGLFRISLQGIPAADLDIQLYTTLGVCVYKQKLTNKNSFFSGAIDLSGIPEGIYLLQVGAGENRFGQKLIIQH
jgi:hypothetical protein